MFGQVFGLIQSRRPANYEYADGLFSCAVQLLNCEVVEVGAGKHFVDAVSLMHSFIIYDLNVFDSTH